MSELTVKRNMKPKADSLDMSLRRRLNRKASLMLVSEEWSNVLGLIDVQASDGSFVMRVDAESVASGAGRNSVRITSKDKFADVRRIRLFSSL